MSTVRKQSLWSPTTFVNNSFKSQPIKMCFIYIISSIFMKLYWIFLLKYRNFSFFFHCQVFCWPFIIDLPLQTLHNIVSGQCFCQGTLKAVSLHHTSFSCRNIFISFYLPLTTFCKFCAFLFSINKLWRHFNVTVKCQFATWMTDLIFDSDFQNKN